MGKGARGARFDVSLVLDTFGGMGSVVAKMKITEGRKVVAESTVPMTQFEGSAEGDEMMHVVGRHDAEETFKTIAGNLEQFIRRLSK